MKIHLLEKASCCLLHHHLCPHLPPLLGSLQGCQEWHYWDYALIPRTTLIKQNICDVNHYLWEKHHFPAQVGQLHCLFFLKNKIKILQHKPLFYYKFLFKNHLTMQLHPEKNAILPFSVKIFKGTLLKERSAFQTVHPVHRNKNIWGALACLEGKKVI